MKEYEYIYGTPMEQDVCDILALAGAEELTEEIKEYLERVMPHCSVHFGQIYPNAATIAGTLRIMVKTIANDYGIRFPMQSVRK